MMERRATDRIQLNRLAMLSLGGIPGIHSCIVRDISGGGARLCSCGFHIFAKDFLISFDEFKSGFRCHIVWRRDNECGVAFSRQQRFAWAGMQQSAASASP